MNTANTASITQVTMPQLGESVVEGTVSRWLKKEGDSVAEFEPIVEISTDKVDTEIPSPAGGVVLRIYVSEGTTVAKGTLLAELGPAGSKPSAAPVAAPTVAAPAHLTQTPSAMGIDLPASEGPRRYSPVVMRMANQHQIDLNQVRGTGMGGRVTKKDVEALLVQAASSGPKLEAWEQPGGGDLFKPTDEIFRNANASNAGSNPAAPAKALTPLKAPPLPAPAPANGGQPLNLQMGHTTFSNSPATANSDLPGDLVAHSAMRRTIATHMLQSRSVAPHVTTVFEVDMSRTMAHWKANEADYAKQNVRLTLTAYFVLAIAGAAAKYPVLNSRWTDEGLFVPHTVNVGMAVALSEGLIVPVIRNVQDLNLMGVARAVGDLAVRARQKALKPDETRAGTITLTNHGVSGSLLATPIINQPQSAIVGVGAVKKRVVVLEDKATGQDAMAIRPMLYATLTFDHRVADGAMGDAFLAHFKAALEGW
jgi:pyruvate/2-oxoglutarate dehydrogenase complex dihydrolipoamide acyltransferase (E2) component